MKQILGKLFYKIKNWKAQWRAFYLGTFIVMEGTLAKVAAITMGGSGYEGANRMTGTVNITLTRANPKWWQAKTLDLGCVGKRIVTTAFINYLRDDLANAAGGADISNFRYHECGTGVVAESAADTALGTPCTTVLNPSTTRAVGTQANGVSLTYSSVGTLTFSGVAAVTEHGLFNTTTVGVLMDRTVFAAVTTAAADSIQFTYTLTMSGS